VTHSDPSGIGHIGSSKKLKKASQWGLEKYAQHLHADARFLEHQDRSRLTGISGHDKPEHPVTIGRNDWSRLTRIAGHDKPE